MSEASPSGGRVSAGCRWQPRTEDSASGGGGGELGILLEYYRINGPLTNSSGSRFINMLSNAT